MPAIISDLSAWDMWAVATLLFEVIDFRRVSLVFPIQFTSFDAAYLRIVFECFPEIPNKWFVGAVFRKDKDPLNRCKRLLQWFIARRSVYRRKEGHNAFRRYQLTGGMIASISSDRADVRYLPNAVFAQLLRISTPLYKQRGLRSPHDIVLHIIHRIARDV